MSQEDKGNNRKLTRSVKLRKYASVYKSFVRKIEQSAYSKSPRRSRVCENYSERNKREKKEKPVEKKKERKHRKENMSKPKKKDQSTKRPLNTYQKFVQVESKKDKYKELSGKHRLSAIAAEWKRINKT